MDGSSVELAAAYPEVRIYQAPDLSILLNRIQPFTGLPDAAVLVTVIPQAPRLVPMSWAWWVDGIWIGERHTNYTTGSICAFEPIDGTWTQGESIVPLLDLHVVWVARHIYLRRMGRWPGRQVLHTAFERIAEHRPGELCGCDSRHLYEECCRDPDIRIGAVGRLAEFLSLRPKDWHRRPPVALTMWLSGREAEPPTLGQLFY